MAGIGVCRAGTGDGFVKADVGAPRVVGVGAVPAAGIVGCIGAAAAAGGIVGGVGAASVADGGETAAAGGIVGGIGAAVAAGAGAGAGAGRGDGVTGPSAGITKGGIAIGGGGVSPSSTTSNDEIGAASETGAGSSGCIAAGTWSAFSRSGRYMPSSDARNGLPDASAASAARRIHTTASRRSPRAHSALAVDKPHTTSSESSDRGSGSFTECSAITCPLP
jgi:hypothetical protein